MLKANNMRALLIVSVALFALFSSANMFPARTFLESITDNSKRQIVCPFEEQLCESDLDCINLPYCPSKLKPK